jgi:hypothetical protein
MGFFSDDYKISGSGSKFEIKCNLRQPGRRKKCTQSKRFDSEKECKQWFKDHKKWHKDQKNKIVNQYRGRYDERVAELMEEYEDMDNVPKHKFSGLHTKGIPGIPDGQNVTGLVYDNQGRRVSYDELKRHVQGWD